METIIGQTILHYHIIQKIGEGGMGEVYKAEDTKLKRIVAIKFLPFKYLTDEYDKIKLMNEARIAASLNHPNIATVYSFEEYEDNLFIVMEYVSGRDLKEVIISSAGKNMSDILDFSIQIAEGLNTAHKKGIIHRDIKSSNIMLTDDKRIKVLDFGLACISGNPDITKKGSTPGTTAYMSPEQLRGEEVDFRSDIWSFGIVLYEMLTGQLPFSGNFEQAIIYSVIHEKLKPPVKIYPDIPEQIENIVLRCLEKKPDKRFLSAEKLLDELKLIKNTRPDFKKISLSDYTTSGIILKPHYVAFLIILIIALLFLFINYSRIFYPVNIREITGQLDKLVKEEKYFVAFDLAEKYYDDLKKDSLFRILNSYFSDTLNVKTSPEDVKIYIKRFIPNEQQVSGKGEFIGYSPVKNFRIARGDYLLTLEIDGYSSVQRTASSYPIIREFPVPHHGINLQVGMVMKKEEFKNMVFVPGGDYKIVSWSIPNSPTVKLDDYYIDKYEVSNSDYKEFISAGGYVRKEFWRQPIIKDDKEIPWEKAIGYFTDKSRLPGPRNWINQDYPEGKGNHPVTDITWYEAAAYAEFRNKSLPSIYQWEKAARNGIPNNQGLSMPWSIINSLNAPVGRANFNGKGTEPVDSYEFGISKFGCYNMAGNVKEWCRNKSNEGYLQTGGSWEDPYYVYSDFGSFPGLSSSGLLGFRCVNNIKSESDSLTTAPVNKNYKSFSHRPVNINQFKSLSTFYRYDKKQLNSEILAKEEKDFWIKEKIAFDCPYGERITGFLFLPKIARKPYQCIVWDPHSGVYFLGAAADWAAEVLYSGNIKSGRALFVIVPKGSADRKWEYGGNVTDYSSVLYRERIVHWVTEQRIAVDYLSTRDDIDLNRISFNATSTGSNGFIIPAVETRFSAVILIACGIEPESLKSLPEVNPNNFIPYYNVPTLILNGKYDEVVSYHNSIQIYNLLPRPKEIELVNSGHTPPLEIRVPIVNKWLDKILGPVKFKE